MVGAEYRADEPGRDLFQRADKAIYGAKTVRRRGEKTG